MTTLVLCACLVAAFVAWPVTKPWLRDSIARQIERATGFEVTTDGVVSVRLLPRPSVRVAGVSMRGLSGAITLDAVALQARLDWLALCEGQARLAGASLDQPTVAADLDRLHPFLDRLGDRGQSAFIMRLLHTPGLSLRSGVIRLRSSDPRRDTLLTDVTADFSWPVGGAEVTLSGTATWHGVGGAFDVSLDHPDDLMGGGHVLASAAVRSPMLDMEGKGTLFGSGETQASGTLHAATPDLPGFLRAIGRPAPQLGNLQAARLTGTVEVSGDTLSLNDTALTLDSMLFEGALAVRQRGERVSIAGTLATDTIDLGSFLGTLPDLVTPQGQWSEAMLQTSAIADDDIDLRISAQSAKLGDFALQDGSLSLQSGDGRLELSVAEARAYDGLLKGRVVATVAGGTTDLRAEATVSRLDLGALMASAPGRFHASGILTGHTALESHGTTAAQLIAGLSGEGQLALRNGEIGGKLVTAIIQTVPSAMGPAVPLAGGSTPFDTATLAFLLRDGVATLNDSWIAWPADRADLVGSASLATQTLDMQARIGTLDNPERYDLTGSWRDLHLNPSRPRS